MDAVAIAHQDPAQWRAHGHVSGRNGMLSFPYHSPARKNAWLVNERLDGFLRPDMIVKQLPVKVMTWFPLSNLRLVAGLRAPIVKPPCSKRLRRVAVKGRL
jgi:hypothetical protein